MSAVTVVLPTYNGMPFLPQAVRSILDQSLADLKLLIIDDGSSDGTGEYLGRLDDPRIEVVRGAHRGLGAVLNHGLDLCTTEFLARMDADDLSWPRRLERQLAFLRSRPEVGMLGSQVEYIAGNQKRVLSPSIPCDHAGIMAALKKGDFAMAHGAVVFRTAVLRRIGGYRIKEMAGEEWDVFLRMGEVAQVANHEQVLYAYRVHRHNSDVRRLVKLGIGIRYACHCAALREHARAEPTLEEFREAWRSRPWWARMMVVLDSYALTQYRMALVSLADDRRIRGCLRLGWAGLFSPRRTLVRLRRMIFGFAQASEGLGR
jgi:glycosyltransferase involved in cell wall biosynthesis